MSERKKQILDWMTSEYQRTPGWNQIHGTMFEMAANALEKSRAETELERIAHIDNERLKDLELRRLILMEHCNDFDVRDLLKIVGQTVLDVAISQERIATVLEELKRQN